MELLDLPDELLSKVFRYLTASELVAAGLVCRRLHELEQNSEHLWKWFCWRDFKASEEKLWHSWSFRDFYSKALYKYRFVFGWWKRNVNDYGGLALVKMENGVFVAYECLPPMDDFIVTNLVWVGLVDAPGDSEYSRSTFNHLRFRRMFAIEPAGSEAAIVCYQTDKNGVESTVHDRCADGDRKGGDQGGNSPAVIERVNDGFRVVCHRPDQHALDYSQFLRLHHGIVVKRSDCVEVVMEEFEREGYDLREKFAAFAKAVCDCQFEPIRIQHAISQAVKYPCAKPGLFFSLYSVHGWEIFNFRYSDDGSVLEGIKVKGDPNIPAGKVSVRVLLDKPIYLTVEDQTSERDIRKAIRRARDDWSNQTNDPEKRGDGLHPFRLPGDCVVSNETAEQPKFYRCAFLSECQVAEKGYVDPKFVECLFFVFDDDTVAVLWIDFRTLFHYFRATNQNDF